MKLILKDKQRAFFTSDTHYNHKSIVRGTSGWTDKSGCRDFDTLEEHNSVLVENLNSMVGEDDILFHLGDWSFGGFEMIEEFRSKIICKNIHLILGNHDHHIERNKGNCRKLFSSVDYYLQLSIDKNLIVLSHWPMKVWDNSGKGSWQLHGHCHNSLPSDEVWLSGVNGSKDPRKTMDIGVDTNKLFPYSYEELKNIMNSRIISSVDHH